MKTRLFIITASLIFVATAAAKLISAYQPVAALNVKDTLFEFMTTRQLLLGAAAIELAVVAVIVWLRDRQRQLMLIAWLSTMFLVYRVGVHLVQPPGVSSVPCPCWATPPPGCTWTQLIWIHRSSFCSRSCCWAATVCSSVIT